MIAKIKTAPAAEPISASEAKLHCRVDIATDDTLIANLITAAREKVEEWTWEALISQTWYLYLDAWPAGTKLKLPFPPLQSVTAITYTDEDGTGYTMSSDDYMVDAYSEPGRIVLKSGSSWPAETLQEAVGIRVEFVAGYGAAGSNVPQRYRQAILLLVSHWYENREPLVVSGAIPKELEFTVKSLIGRGSRRF